MQASGSDILDEDLLEDDLADLIAAGEGPAPAGPPGHAGGETICVPFGGNDCHVNCYFSDGRFQATCTDPRHQVRGNPCRLTRGSARARGAEPANGRPLGLLAAWVQSRGDFATREEHRDAFFLMSLSQARREAAREALRNSPSGPELLAHERPLDPGEPE